MFDSLITELGVGGIFVVLVLRMIFDFLEKREIKKNGLIRVECLAPKGQCALMNMLKPYIEGEQLLHADMRMKLKELHKWHAPDQQGEQLWKNKRMIELTEAQQKSIEANTEVLRELTIAIRDLRKLLEVQVRGDD